MLTTTVLWPFFRDYPDEPVFISFLHLLWSIASILFNVHAWQSLHNLSPSPVWSTFCLEPSTSCSIHFFTQSLSSFRNTCPYYCDLFCCSTEIMSSNPSSLSTLYLELYFFLNVTHPFDHSHLHLLKCHLIFFSYRPGFTSMQYTTLHTTAVQSPSHYQWYIHIGKQWYQLPEFIPSKSNSGLHSCISISVHIHHVT